MTDLERRALMGDRQAQEECTRQGILLPCPFCGSESERGANKRDSRKRFGVYHMIATIQCKICTAKVTMAGTSVESAYKNAERHWNDRAAPPAGRCGECAHWYKGHCTSGPCAAEETDADFYCQNFKQKEDT